MIKVFLSSTGRDLQAYRDAVHAAIGRLDGFCCLRMEDFGAVDREPLGYCRDRVGQADVLVGVIGHLYGSTPPDDLRSFTEHEYDAAENAGLPCLMFVAPEEFPVPAGLQESDSLRERQQAFRTRVMDERIAASFGSPTDLASRVVESLSNWARQRAVSKVLRIPEARFRLGVSPPGALLRGDYGVVPFHAREHELNELMGWVEREAIVSVRLITSPGGMGKTRFAVETCKRLNQRGWTTGFIDHRDASITPEVLGRVIAEHERLLIVLDYAETCRDLVESLLSSAVRRESGRVRVLLLARGAGDWWESMKRAAGSVGELLAGPATGRISLGALGLTPEERRDSYRVAARAFASLLETNASVTEQAEFDAEYFERVLLLHMAALAAVEGIDVKGENGILDWVLDREGRFWEELATSRTLAPTVTMGIGRAMAAITLGGGADDEREALKVVSDLEFFAGQSQDVLHAVVRLLHDSYPGEKWIEPVQPDLLGEHLVERELNNGADELFELVFGPEEPTL